MSQQLIYVTKKVFDNALKHSQDGSLWDLLNRRGAVIILLPEKIEKAKTPLPPSSRSNVVHMTRRTTRLS